MENKGSLQRLLIGIPLIVICLVTLSLLPFLTNTFSKHPQLGFAVSLDFLLTIPLIYFFTIRKTSIPKITVVPVLVLCMLICGFVLPKSEQWYLSGFKQWVFPLVELAVVAVVFFKMRNILRSYKSEKRASIDFFTALKDACSRVLPKPIVIPFATEIAVFYYGFVAWKNPKRREGEFSYHKESGTVTLLIAVIGIVAIEMVTVHIVLDEWSAVLAWVLTILSAYTGIQMFGIAKGVTRRPIVVEKDTLKLRYSFMKEAEIPLSIIESVRIDTKDLNPDEKVAKLSLLHDLEGHNVILELKEPAILHGMYGTHREFIKIAFHVDQKEAFVASIQND